MRTRCLSLALLVPLLVAACGSNKPTGPSATDVTGTWSGTSTYPNSPFQLRLAQTGGALVGDYNDAHDRSLAVNGTFANSTLHVVVDFGDAKLNLDATLSGARTASGTMYTSALGNRLYPFTMTR